MTPRELFSELSKKAIYQHRFGWSNCIFVPWREVVPHLSHFDEDRYQPGKYRFGGLFRNLHLARTPDGYANLHLDHGNPNRNVVVGGLAHGMLDCIVYPTVCIWRLGKYVANPTLEELRSIWKS